MPPAEVISCYHDLWHVEQSFRISKTDLAARPMFHRTRDAIEAHLTCESCGGWSGTGCRRMAPALCAGVTRT